MHTTVIDSIPGSGKTTYAFELMKSDSNSKYIYCSPYLAEVGDGKNKGRVQRALPSLQFKTPKPLPNKSESLKRLIAKGENVAVSHSLLSLAGNDLVEDIKKHGYCLILDETIQPIEPYQDLSSNDVSILLDSGRVALDGYKVRWNPDYSDYRGRDQEVFDLCSDESIYYHSNCLLRIMNSRVWKAFSKCTILTYMFNGSIMARWLELKDIQYEVLTDAIEPPEVGIKTLKNSIEFLEPSKTIQNLHTVSGRYYPATFSVSWYERNENKLSTIRRSLTATAKKLPKSDKIFWTTFKQYEEALRGPRYSKPEKNDKEILISPFVPKNMRASNDYKNYNTCFYCCNIYPHLMVSSFLSKNGVHVDPDQFALSELIQFIFRGSVREGKKMKLLILSDRMRQLLDEFLKEV